MENKSPTVNSNAEIVAPDVFYIQTLIVNVCFVGKPRQENMSQPPGWVLIDAGVSRSAGQIKTTAEELYGKDNPPQAIILTHGHFDHIGALEELLKEWDRPVYAPEGEIPYLTGKAAYPPPDPSVSEGLMAKLSPLYPRDPIDLKDRVKVLPEDGSVPFMPGWRWIATPGHTSGHISLFRDADKVLIAGDAFTTVKQESAWAVMTQRKEIHGPPAYFTINWEEAGRSIEKLWDLKPAIVITGHGRPMKGEELKVELEELKRDFDRESIPDQGRYVEHPIPVNVSVVDDRSQV